MMVATGTKPIKEQLIKVYLFKPNNFTLVMALKKSIKPASYMFCNAYNSIIIPVLFLCLCLRILSQELLTIIILLSKENVVSNKHNSAKPRKSIRSISIFVL